MTIDKMVYGTRFRFYGLEVQNENYRKKKSDYLEE